MNKFDFVSMVNSHAKTMHKSSPPIAVAHPAFGMIGRCIPGHGFEPHKGRWASTRAIMRGTNKTVVKALRKFEEHAPSFAVAGAAWAIGRDPIMIPALMAAISTYDGIIAARGGGLFQDIWMNFNGAAFTPTTNFWYDLMKAGWSPGSPPSVVEYDHGGNGGGLLDSASSGTWLQDTTGAGVRYLVSAGLTCDHITGFAMAMLTDNLSAGWFLLTANTTITPAAVIATSRHTAAASDGNQIIMVLTTTLTHTGAPTVTVTYEDSGGAGNTLSSVMPATGAANKNLKVLGNTLEGVNTVNAATPFMPQSNSGTSGAFEVEEVVIAGGTCTVGTVDIKIVRPLILMPFIAADTYIEQDATLNIGNMVELEDVANVCGCLSWLVFSGGASAARMSAMLRTVEG